MRRTIQYGIGSLAAAALLLTGVQAADAATAYAGARQELDNFTVQFEIFDGSAAFSGQTETQGNVDGSGEVNTDATDADQAYAGPAATAPSENTFSFKGETDPDYGRGDTLVGIGDEAFNADTVGEAYTDGPGTAGGYGRWAMEADFTFETPQIITLSTGYDWALDITGTGTDLSSFSSAQVNVEAVLYDADTNTKRFIRSTASPTS